MSRVNEIWVMKEIGERMQTGLIWLRIVTSGGVMKTVMIPRDP
jgi:hypothetical protein